ncbi:kinase-like protein [Coprinellus micaceus]|uniref:Kinase-like protein n=1 Tax=Coprinellus micaceus TaxID=71717 RepID=A0A4Y7SQN6_COPMI|nr:kinase-like protein [Coprinellus micaceus]
MFPLENVPKETNAFPDLTTQLHQTDAFPCAIGEHSDIFRAHRVTDDKREHILALKTLRAGSSSKPNFEELVQTKLVELGHQWAQLNHPNVAKVHGVAYGSGRLPAIVMDYYEAGSIVSCMKARSVTNEEKLQWVREIALGLKYLHRRKAPVVHGDLRGANAFVKANKECVLTDVGMVYMTDMPEFVMMKSAATCRFAAPELMDPNVPRQTAEGPECTTQSDVFAFAMIVVQIFSGDVPFSHKKNDTSIIPLILKGERPELPQYIQENPALAKLVQDCWVPEPHRRPNMSDVCYRLGLTSYFRYLLEWIGLL